MPLTTAAKVKAWADPDLAAAFDAELALAVGRADKWIPSILRRNIEDEEFTRYFDGSDAAANRTVIHLNPNHRPVIHTGGTLVVVTEDGVALTAAVGYSTTADFYVVNANEPRRCELRREGVWSAGTQNIKVVYTAGYTTVPADIEQLANEVAWLFFKTPKWLGKSARAKAGESVSWKDELTPQSQSVVAAWMAF